VKELSKVIIFKSLGRRFQKLLPLYLTDLNHGKFCTKETWYCHVIDIVCCTVCDFVYDITKIHKRWEADGKFTRSSWKCCDTGSIVMLPVAYITRKLLDSVLFGM